MLNSLSKFSGFTLALVPLLLLSGCARSEKGKAGCGGPTLPGTGICAAQAASYLQFAGGPRPQPPAGCEWVVDELGLPGGRFLLYQTARCGGKARSLRYVAAPNKAELKFDPAGPAVVEMFAAQSEAPSENGNAAILRHARAAIPQPADAARCSVRPARNEHWPADAVVVDVSAAEAAKAPNDEPRSACGHYGLDEDAQIFWRAAQGFAWFFDLGQDSFEIDPGSFTVLTKDPAGKWVRAGN